MYKYNKSILFQHSVVYRQQQRSIVMHKRHQFRCKPAPPTGASHCSTDHHHDDHHHHVHHQGSFTLFQCLCIFFVAYLVIYHHQNVTECPLMKIFILRNLIIINFIIKMLQSAHWGWVWTLWALSTHRPWTASLCRPLCDWKDTVEKSQKHTVEKSKMQPRRICIWKDTVEKSQKNATKMLRHRPHLTHHTLPTGCCSCDIDHFQTTNVEIKIWDIFFFFLHHHHHLPAPCVVTILEISDLANFTVRAPTPF